MPPKQKPYNWTNRTARDKKPCKERNKRSLGSPKLKDHNDEKLNSENLEWKEKRKERLPEKIKRINLTSAISILSFLQTTELSRVTLCRFTFGFLNEFEDKIHFWDNFPTAFPRKEGANIKQCTETVTPGRPKFLQK